MMDGDQITTGLRVVLALVAAAGSGCVIGLFRRSHDPNPIPWVFFASALAVYALILLLFVAGERLTIADWWRPVFSVLNVFNIVGALWVLRRSVNHAW